MRRNGHQLECRTAGKLKDMCSRLIGAALIALGPVASCSQAPDPRAVQVDALFAGWNRPDSPGCGVAVGRSGSILFERGYGMANLERRVPITPATSFDVASIAKPFATMSVMLLVEDGRLSLEDEVWRYIPEWADRKDRITIRHLLAHTAGLRDVFLLTELIAPAPAGTDINEHLLGILARQRAVNFAPGSEFSYNNGGYNLLARIVQRVSGQPYHTFVNTRIFVPLGMTQSIFRDGPVVVRPDQALGYHGDEAGFHLAQARGADTSRIVGNSGLTTTARDLLRWQHNFDSPRVGSMASFSQMETPVTLSGGGTSSYGLGLEVGEHLGVKTVGHGGGDRGIAAYVIRYPGRQLSAAVLCNVDNVGDRVGALARRVAEKFLGDVANAPPSPASESAKQISLPPEAFAGKVGLYRDPTTDTFGRIYVRDGKLMASADAGDGPADSVELVPIANSQFVVPGTPLVVEFVPGSPGRPQQVRVTGAGRAPMVSEQVPTGWAPTTTELGAFAGQYASPDLGVTYTAVVSRSGLVLQVPGRDAIALQPVFRDAFYGSLVDLVRFSRDPAGRVGGFTVNRSRVRNLQFERVR